MSTKNLDFYKIQDEPNQSCLLALRERILNIDTVIYEVQKYNMPCFMYNKKAICYLLVDQHLKEPYMLFVEGKRINHPKLEPGNSLRMKILRINPYADLPIDAINEILQQLITLIKTRIKRENNSRK